MSNLFIFANNVSTTLSASATSSQTTLTLSSVANIPTSFPSGAYFALTLNDAATRQVFEVVYVTAAPSGNNVTVVRGQEGTSAVAWNIGDYCYGAVTSGELTQFQQNLHAYIAITSSETWTVPSGVSSVLVTLVGGGGGGAGAVSGSSFVQNSGGGAGGGAQGRYSVTPGANVTVTIGAGGGGGATDSAGSAGGSTSFGSFCSATGGGGGTYNSGTTALGGTGSNGTVNINGGPAGLNSNNTSSFPGGFGGSSPFGLGFGGTASVGQGLAGIGYGAGGASYGGIGGGTGGAGTSGIVIIQY